MSNPNLLYTNQRGPPDGTAATPRILQNRSRVVPFPRSVITSRVIHTPGQQGRKPVFSRSLPGPSRPIQQQQMVQQVSARSSVPVQAHGRQTIVAKPSAVGTSVYVAFRPPVQQSVPRTQPPPPGSAPPGQMRHSSSIAAGGRYLTPIRRIMRGGRLLTPITRARVAPATPSGRAAVDQFIAPQPFSHLVRSDQPSPQAQQFRNLSIPANSNTSSFDLAQAAKKKAASDEMKAALQAGAVYHDNKNHEFDIEEENLGHAETYAEYVPSKLRSGLSHPDCVVETASLSSVQPPDVHYQMTIPEELIDTGCISALQLEAVIYACQMHQNNLPSGERCGYLIGDGAGVGKGRTIACIIFENYLLGRKRSIWLSVSSDLRYDSERDFRDIGAEGIDVYQLSKMKYAAISGPQNGNIKKGVMFATYSSLIGECRSATAEYRSRIKQLIQWCGGPAFDGVLVFDECHRAKNLCPATGTKPTKTGRMVLELQKELPNARVIYASATGASEPKNMAYMTRLGLWGRGQSFPQFSDFINTVERRGVGAMEVVAMDMKQRGMYLARQLSFHGVSFRVQEVPLSDNFVRVYDDSVKVWLECRRQFQNALSRMSEERRSGCKVVWGQFWSAHQRFFKYLCIGAKVDACVQIARDAIKQNKCVVIGLQSTGEARTLEQLEDCGGELTEFVSTAKAVLQGLVEKHFPTSLRQSTSAGNVLDSMERMFGGGSKERKRRARSPRYYGARKDMLIPPAKRQNTAQEDLDEDENNNESVTSESDDSDDDIMLGDDDEAWINTLMAELESSSDEDSSSANSDGNSESEDDDEWAKKQKQMVTDSSSDDDFNPFLADTAGDPWEGREPIVDKRLRTKAQMAESKRLKRQRRIDREKRRKEMRKELRKKKRDAVSESLKRTTAMKSDAMKLSASHFIESSRIIDSGAADGFGFTPRNNLASIKEELLAAIERLGRSLPTNTLDHLIDELGGPPFVAELTGRKGRVVTKEDGAVGYELRSANADVALEKMNMEEKDMFMRGEKKIAVISEAASSGISLQSDRRAENKLRRVHITLELPWSADKAIQQFGRTHRSNQVSAPEYIFLISELAGEKRFASIVAKRLESLGALTHGDRRATETRDLSQFNLDTKYGRAALDVVCRSVVGTLFPPLIPPPSDYQPENFFQDMRHYMEGVGLLTRAEKGVYTIEREASNMSKFLNRILGLPVHAQNALFQYFLDVLKELVTRSKHDGTYDLGIMDIGTAGDVVRKLETRVFVGHAQKGSFQVEMHKVAVERGVSWEQAMDLYNDHNNDDDGFYLSRKGATGKRAAALIYGIGKIGMNRSLSRMYALTHPSTGRAAELKGIEYMNKRFRKASPEEAEQVWKDQYENAATTCQHLYFHGKCHKMSNQSEYCEIGRRTRTYFILSGAVLSVWPIVEHVFSNGNVKDIASRGPRMQLIRVRTEENQKIVGILVGVAHVRGLLARLEQHCSRMFVAGGSKS